MATSSIFSNIRIEDAASRYALLKTMEAAEKAAEGRIRSPLDVIDLKTKEEISEFFGTS